MVDTGAEMNIIREADTIKFGLEVDRSDCGILHGANNKAVFCGTASNVLLEIGRVKARACFFVMPDVDHCILLGRSFLCRTETLMYNKHDGSLILILCDPACGNYEVITCRNTRPRSLRNRPNPGSFTIEESEDAHRRLMAEPEEEVEGKAFSLSLSDVGKTMDIVATHEMTDPDAIQALREQVLEYPKVGEMELVYRLPKGGMDLAVAQAQARAASQPFLGAGSSRDAGGLPNADALSESCARRPIISLIDLYSGYDQFPVYPPDRPVTVMHMPRGLIHMNVAPQGWTNAVAMVQRNMIRVMQTVSPYITQPYIDDLAVKGPRKTENDEVLPGVRRFVWRHVQDLDKVLGLLEQYNLTASGPKSKHCMREATILGFVCNENDRRSDVKKTDKIVEWPVPFRSVTHVRSFLGTCGFWRSFIKNFAAKIEQLRKLVRQDQEWTWGEDPEEVVTNMKEEFREGGLVLGAPDYDTTEARPFIVETDAGPTTLGGVLIQADIKGKERPLRFESRTLCTSERNYSQFKRETLAVLHCLRIFRNYIFGRRFILRVDPTALAFSLRKYVPSDPTVARWLTYIWMFNFELERIPGNKNMADGLSRINCDRQDGEAVEDTPPVDGFLYQDEDIHLHINKWSPRVPNCVGHPIWHAPNGYERRAELVLKPFEEEDPWGGLTTPSRVEVETSQKADEYLDQRIRSVSKTSFDRYMMLEADLRGKEVKEAGLESRLGTIEAEVCELRALVASHTATILELKQQLHGSRDGAESSRPGGQSQQRHGVSEQPNMVEPQQEAPMGRIILEPEEAKAKRKAEREAFEFRAPTELAVLPTMAADPAMPPSLEERLPSASDEPLQGSIGGSLDVLLEAVHTMQEDAGLFSPESKLEEPLESEMGGAMEGIIAGRPQGLDTPDYEPEGARAQPGLSLRGSEAGSERPRDVPQCHELDGEARETPSPAGPQRKKKRPRKSFDSTCFYCTKGEHRALQCLKFLKDQADGKVSKYDGKMYDRQGRVVEQL
ncbi:hypothetical protein CBR_g40942 [Chara braunii]|uniref:RNA-directed DNA polymerase n=1 Tax=Chara braunii TaxID=69332 RepID=A0A388LUV6_CHABU|nr:hypothetical protein CBR_g40942 [Chara braunii]|eukprot:GBG86041.1 hypothetical protein CBR_g40942 [Chara braunii]